VSGNPGDDATLAPLGHVHRGEWCAKCVEHGFVEEVRRNRATPAPLDCGHDLVGIRLRGYREGRAEALGDVREFVDESHDRAVAYAKETT